jgi:hypothetical protein
MERGTGERSADHALGSVGLVLMALVCWASARGRPGRAVIWLVTAIGWVIDRATGPVIEEKKKWPESFS